MVNFGLNPASILGIFLAVAGAGLYYLRSVRPELSRDHDIFFAAIGLLCGLILLFQGWRLDPILGFGQFLLAGSAVFFAVESIRMRGLTVKQVKENSPIVDEDRPVSRSYSYDSYQAELEDDYEPIDERPLNRRLKGSPDPRRSRSDDYEDEYSNRLPRRISDPRLSSDRSTKRSRRPSRRPPEGYRDPWSEPSGDAWGSSQRSDDEWGDTAAGVAKKPRRPSRGDLSGPPENTPEAPPRRRKTRRRPPEEPLSPPPPSDIEATPADYVDYQPIEQPDEDPDNPDNFDY